MVRVSKFSVCVPEYMSPRNTEDRVRVWMARRIEDSETHGWNSMSLGMMIPKL